jgi:PKD domain
MSATGDFDAAFQVSQFALQRVFSAMHAAGSLQHALASVRDQELVELVIGAPVIALDPAAGAAGELRATARSRVLYHERSIDDASNLGQSVACDVTARAALQLDGGDPAPLDQDSQLRVTWNETTLADISVYGASPAFEPIVKQALLDLVRGQPVAELGMGFLAAGAQSASARVIDPGGGQAPLAVVGLNLTATSHGTRPTLQSAFCHQDWALATSTVYVSDQILSRLAAEIGMLPPPHGDAPVEIASGRGGTIYLDSFTIAWTTGAIVLAGEVRGERGGLFGTVTATWTTSVTLSLDAHGGIVASATQPSVQLHEWYAVVGDFFAAGLIERVVAGAVSAQLAGALPGVGAAGFIADIGRRLSAEGRTLSIGLDAAASAVEVRPDAVVIQGTITITQPPRAPISDFAVVVASPNKLVFNASESWSPGGDLTSYRWDFGDGASSQASGQGASFVSEHTYPAGEYAACLTVEDAQGRTRRTCYGVQPGLLILEQYDLEHSANWEFCSSEPTVAFRVSSSGTPIAAASVEAEGAGWAINGQTDAAGVTRLTFDAATVAAHGVAARKPSPFHLGLTRVTASKPGWQSRVAFLWMVDCDALWAAVLDSTKRRDDLFDRLAGYAALKELIASGALKPTSPTLSPFVESPFAPDNPRAKDSNALILSARVLDGITELLVSGGDTMPVAALLGIDPDEPEAGTLMQRRLGEAWNAFERGGERYESRYGLGGDDRRPP